MTVPLYSHIVVVVEENHDYSQIIGKVSAAYINSLALGGTLLTNYHGISHPSEPNYFAMYAGSTFGVTNDNYHSEPDPTLATILHNAGKTFTGYVEESNSDINHMPWEYFPEKKSVEKSFTMFPTSNFSSLPTVSFVIPNDNDNMHNGSISRGDTWLKNHLDAYARWAKLNKSLLIVTWDENNGNAGNHVATILYGAGISSGKKDATYYNHYDLLSTLLAASNLKGPRNAATAAPFNDFNPLAPAAGGNSADWGGPYGSQVAAPPWGLANSPLAADSESYAFSGGGAYLGDAAFRPDAGLGSSFAWLSGRF